MIKELEQKAAKYTDGKFARDTLWWADAYEAYIAGATETTKELQEQIKKMKCCENCKNYEEVITVNETIGNNCPYFFNGCNNNLLNPYCDWELKK